MQPTVVTEEPKAALRRLALGVLLLVLAALAWAAQAFAAASAGHSWDAGSRPPATVHLTAGRSYALSTSGGSAALVTVHASTQPSLSCTYAGAARPTTALDVRALAYDQRVTHEIATFTSPVTGDVSVGCADLGAVFVDDADDAGADYAGVLVIAGAVLALGGVALTLSGLAGRPAATHR